MSLDRRIKVVGQGLILITWWCGALFGSAGLLTWSRGWVCTALYLGSMIANGILVKRVNPGLLEQREKAIAKETKPFDKVFLGLFLPLAIALPVIAGLDAVRFGWAPLPIWTLYPGIVLFAASATLVLWVMVTNPHAENSVRIQEERSHTVVASGPYRYVRHPMYVGLILLYASQALILGSTWALAIAVLITLLFLWRTALEDQTLRQELLGYDQYASITRYRLMPGIW
jgi:protein-S-isoprenylcysteine O-methyltransferase Ste14